MYSKKQTACAERWSGSPGRSVSSIADSGNENSRQLKAGRSFHVNNNSIAVSPGCHKVAAMSCNNVLPILQCQPSQSYLFPVREACHVVSARLLNTLNRASEHNHQTDVKRCICKRHSHGSLLLHIKSLYWAGGLGHSTYILSTLMLNSSLCPSSVWLVEYSCAS